MKATKYLAASAVTALAGIVAVSSATAAPLPPKNLASATAETAVPAALAAAPAVPTFNNGLAQPVFATAAADWVNYELWVQSNFDSDRDGKNDRIHVDVSRPKETDTEGLKVPVIFEDSPYYAGCTTSGGRNETLGAVAVIDWLNGRAKGYTTRTGTEETTAAAWHNGKTAMM